MQYKTGRPDIGSNDLFQTVLYARKIKNKTSQNFGWLLCKKGEIKMSYKKYSSSQGLTYRDIQMMTDEDQASFRDGLSSPKSTTKKAKNIIRNEIKRFYIDRDFGNEKDYVANMKADIDYRFGNRCQNYSDYCKGKAMVDVGNFACYYDDQSVMLSKIYGKEKVDSWDGHKVNDIYGNLIGREYAAMLCERARKGRK